MLHSYFKINIWLILGIITGVYFISLFLEFNYVFTDEFYMNSLSETNTPESVNSIIKQAREDQWLNYPISLLIILVPALLISGILYIGIIFKEYEVKFKKVFKIVLAAQIIFALNYLVSILLRITHVLKSNLWNVNNNYSYQSALVFFKDTELPFYAKYALQMINVTELIFILFLSLGISYLLEIKFSKSLSFVALYYGAAIILWIIFTVFLYTLLYK
jgi:hypothetical protein